LFLGVLVCACTKSGQVPAYLNVPAVSLTTTGAQGSATSRITDAWIYADEELLGVWELPARVPMLREGPVSVRITPGIKRNGMYDDRLRYPFYVPWTGNVEAVREAQVTVQPVVTYLDGTEFWIEAFENAGTLLDATPASDTTLLRFTPTADPDVVLNGSPCGGFVLDEAHRYCRLFTDEDFAVLGGPVFLELDYRTDLRLTVGVILSVNGTPQANPYVYVNPTTAGGGTYWNKIYIDLSPVFNAPGVSQRDLYFEATLPAGQASGHVYLDNIKLVQRAP
jgi:hypothetical protein